MKKQTLLPIQYWLYEHHVPVINGRRIVNAPMKCCMRCKHTNRTHCVNEEDFIICDVNGIQNLGSKSPEKCSNVERRIRTRKHIVKNKEDCLCNTF